jgi:hypothetical protein
MQMVLIDAQTSAIPHQYLRAGAAAVREQEEIPGTRIGVRLGDDQCVEPVAY